MEKNKRSNMYKLEVLKEFLRSLQEFYSALRDFSNIDYFHSGKQYEFSELWNPIAEKKEKIVIYVDNHSAIIDQNLGINKFKNQYDNIVNLLLNARMQNNNVIDNETANIILDEYNQLLQTIKECMNNYEQEIIKIV